MRVVEMASFVSGPYAAMMLADLGAEVIKIEPPKGDPMRRFGRNGRRLSPLFVNLNRGKQAVGLDLKRSEDVAAVRRLLGEADLMISNWRPGTADRLGLDDRSLATANSRLVRVYITGYGSDGPLASAPAFDSVLQARLGLTLAGADTRNGESEDCPVLQPSYLIDKLSAAMVAQAALAALVARSKTGVGERVDVAMLDAGAYLAFPDLMANRTYVADRNLQAVNSQLGAIRPIRASDGWFTVAPVTALQIRRACEILGAPELATELLSLPDAAILTRRLFDSVQAAAGVGTVDEWVTRFTGIDVPAAPCLSIDQHLTDRQVVHNDIYAVEDWPDLGPVRFVRYPAIFSTWGHLRPRGGPPPLTSTNSAAAGFEDETRPGQWTGER